MNLALAAVFAAALLIAAEGTMSSSIQEVKARHEQRLLALPGVVSVGIGRDAEGTVVIVVGLDGPRPQTRAQIPATLEGYSVHVQVIGPVKAR